MDNPRAPTRADLARFITDARTLRAFEQLFGLVPSEFITLQARIDETEAGAALGSEIAAQARSQATAAAAAIEALSVALMTQASDRAKIAALETRIAQLEALALAQR